MGRVDEDYPSRRADPGRIALEEREGRMVVSMDFISGSRVWEGRVGEDREGASRRYEGVCNKEEKEPGIFYMT